MTQRRATGSLFVTLLLLVGGFFAVLAIVPSTVRATTLYVGGVGPGNYTSIQAAVGASSPGDTIFVYSGTYNESVWVYGMLSLVGENKYTTTINGAIMVRGSWVNISGFRILGDSLSGIQAQCWCDLEGLTIHDNIIGPQSGMRAVFLNGTVGMTMFNNTMIRGGIEWMDRTNDQLRFWNTHNIDASNTVNGRPVYYLKDTSGDIVLPGAGQVILANVTDVTVDGEYLNDTSTGIAVAFSRNVTMSLNDVEGTWKGVSLQFSSACNVTHNTLLYNGVGVNLYYDEGSHLDNNNISHSPRGIHAEYASNTTIAENAFNDDNSAGIEVASTSRNLRVFHNNFFNNMRHAADGGVNSWDDGYPSGGNYWSDYVGTDILSGPNQDQPGNDGIGDFPYPVWGGANEDRYPLMRPYITGPTPDLAVFPADVSFSPAPPFRVGSSVLIGAKIWNLGSAPSRPTVVRFHDGVPPSPRIGQDQTLAQVPKGGSANVSVTWTPSEMGNHEVCVVVDPDGLVGENEKTNNMACKDAEVIFSLELKPGHHFISFPMIVANESVESVLSSILCCYDYVRWYEPLDTTSPWKSYVTGRDTNSLLKLDRTMGFWINITMACDFTPTGTRPSSTMIVLHQGWNMVGFPSYRTSYTVANLKADLGLAVTIVEAFDSSATPYYLQRVNDHYTMRAGEGYWIYAPSDATWIVSG